MTDQIAYQEYIQRRYNAFCKTVIRCAALDKILKLKRQWERQVSLDYLMNEKFVQFAASEPDEEYPFTVCGQTVLLCNAALADAISVLPEQTREEILRYYFLRQPQRVIGACIGRSRSTAGRHIQLALQRLREEMGVSRYPYVWGGSNPSTSFDCSGFVCWVFTNSGVHNLPRTTAQGIYNQCAIIPSSEAKPGDIIFFTGTYDSAGPVSHVGIYVGDGMMIHCGSPIQYANINTSYWQQHFYAFGRL